MHSLSFSTQTLAILAVLPTLVRSHGYVTKITFGSNTVDTWAPFVDPYADPAPAKLTRKINSDGPVSDLDSPTITCGAGADSPVGTVLKGVKAGEDVTMQWTTWPGDHRGPVMTYMASCDGDCTKFDATNGKWFKIDEKGYENGKWASDTLIEQGSSWTFKIPAALKSGEYLLRHEILALHSAFEKNGAQFYPSCNQISLTSSGNLQPDGVSLPGAYSANDPGIFLSIWEDGFNSYKIPGPAVISGGSSSGSNSGSSAASSNAATSESTDASNAGSDSSSSESTGASTGASSGESASASTGDSAASATESSASTSEPADDDDEEESYTCGARRKGKGRKGRKGSPKSKTAAAPTAVQTPAAEPVEESTPAAEEPNYDEAPAAEESSDEFNADEFDSDKYDADETAEAETGAEAEAEAEEPEDETNDEESSDDTPAAEQPALVTSQPALVTSQPALVTSQPPLVTSQPPLMTSQPPLVTEQPALATRALPASVPTAHARRAHTKRTLSRKGHRLPMHVMA